MQFDLRNRIIHRISTGDFRALAPIRPGPALAVGADHTMKTLRIPAVLVLALSAALATACANVEEDTGNESTETSEIAARPKVELWTDAGGAYHFHLLASNGQILVTSQSYSARTSALNGMLSVLSNGSLAERYKVKTAANGGAYFTVVAGNNAVIATSEVYSTDAAARAGVTATLDAVDAYYEHWDTATGARFDVFQGADGRFFFDVHAKNGAIVLQSQGYSTEAAALNGAFSVQDNGVNAARYTVLKSTDGKWYYNLTSTNTQVIATSQRYTTKQGAERARDSMIALLPLISIL
jgi:uncharacterized protein YegP (UPF0339 family)